MSQENVEIVRAIYEAWERGDFSATEWLHPEIEFAMVGGPSPGTWTGLAGMAEATHDFLSAWETCAPSRRSTASLTASGSSCSSITEDAARQAAWNLGRCRRRTRPCSTSAMAR